MVYKGTNKTYDFRNYQKLEIILLVWIQQILNKRIY